MLPAGKGEPLTLVATDVEGSTDLWEWDKESMMEAISIHDNILRSHLAENHGYEVATEVYCRFFPIMLYRAAGCKLDGSAFASKVIRRLAQMQQNGIGTSREDIVGGCTCSIEASAAHNICQHTIYLKADSCR